MKNILFSVLCLLAAFSSFAAAQPTPSSAGADSAERAAKILEKAVNRLGGERYLQVKTLSAKGFYTVYREGVQETQTFADYIAYPNRERTEFKGASVNSIQTNFDDKGWTADVSAHTIKDQTPEQIESFRRYLQSNLDYVLRGNWKKEGAKIEFAGRREGGVGKRNEAVRIIYPNGLTVDFEFAATDGLPVKSFYKSKNAEGVDVKEEERFAQFVEFDGVYVPLIVERFVDSKQTSRVNYQNITLNAPLSDALFAKPELKAKGRKK